MLCADACLEPALKKAVRRKTAVNRFRTKNIRTISERLITLFVTQRAHFPSNRIDPSAGTCGPNSAPSPCTPAPFLQKCRGRRELPRQGQELAPPRRPFFSRST